MTSIAISGMSCQFPGAANIKSFWDLIKSNQIVTQANPIAADDHDPRRGQVGGYIDGIEEFDASFFGISAREALLMDPQQRLLLQNVWHAIEDAGLTPKSLRGSRTGVFVGAMANDWSHIYMPDMDNLNSQTVTGNGLALLANRISYQFDFKGPSLAIDSACSSSLVALHYAIHSLRAGDCDYALVAGVNAIVTPTLQVFYQRAGLAAGDGRCKPFSLHSDGIVRSEGVGVILLQRANVDTRAYAKILGCEVNHDGQSNGLTAPNRFAQESLLRQAYAKLNLTADEISYIECHGTGTQLGDRMEIRALQSIHGAVKRETPCHIGSVKGLIGHTEAASGMAGLIKLALMLHHGHVPASLYADTPNPALTEDSPVQLPKATYQLPVDSVQHMALSAFGLGGTNVHVVLQHQIQAVSVPDAANDSAAIDRPTLFLFSGHSADALKAEAISFAAHMDGADFHDLAALAKQCHAVRSHQPYRAALVADSKDSLQQGLSSLIFHPVLPLIPAVKNPIVSFLFTGQGSQYSGMGAGLYRTQAVFRDAIETCDALFLPLLGLSLKAVMFEPEHAELLRRAKFAQPALFTFEYAMTQLWLSFGIRPQVVMGHSIGEYAAACLAGVFSLDDAVSLIAKRGILIDGLPVGGEMLAIKSDVAPFLDILSDHLDTLAIAAYNGANEIVLSGSSAAITMATLLAQHLELRHRKLEVSHAFHSPLMASIIAEFEQHCSSITFHAPKIKFISSLSGAQWTSIPDAAYWTRHILEPVQFLSAFKALEQDIKPHFGIEIGSASILSPLAIRNSVGKHTQWLASSKVDAQDTKTYLESLASLYQAGVTLSLDQHYQDAGSYQLPPYSFSRTRFWHEKYEPVAAAQGGVDTSSDGSSITGPIAVAPLVVSDNKELIHSTIAAILACEVSAISNTDRLSEDLGFDSITMVELMEKLNKYLPAGQGLKLVDALHITTVAELGLKMKSLSIPQQLNYA